ncbi:MAG: glycosyltransferase family 2 protein [Azoarcus sp.]|nr:glycosyltransferase family 2 protein [Azoarcus sp.]
MPRITVGVSTYNRKAYLRECLRALEKQTWRDFAVIVVDDGSSDGTGEMMKEEFPEVKYVFKENGGDATAKNRVVDEADSEFLVFNDSDDIFLPDALERLVAPLLEYPDHCSYGQYVLIDERGAEQKTRQKRGFYPSGRIVAQLVEHIIVPGVGFMCPLAAFRDHGKYDESLRVGHDYKMGLEMSLTHDFHAMNRVVFKRRRHSGNISGASYEKTRILCAIVEDFCRGHAGDPDLPPQLLARRLARYHATLAREAWKEKLPRETMKKHLEEALRLDFSLKNLWRRLVW